MSSIPAVSKMLTAPMGLNSNAFWLMSVVVPFVSETIEISRPKIALIMLDFRPVWGHIKGSQLYYV